MHYDAVTHTQKAIRNLQSQVRLLLKRHQEQTLPPLIRKSNAINYRESPVSFRSVRQKSQFESPTEIQSLELRQLNTISFDDIVSEKVNLVILKPRSKNKTKIVLPKFDKKPTTDRQNYHHNNNSQKHSVQLIQNSLVEQSLDTINQPPTQQSPKSISPKHRRSVRISRTPRYTNNRASLDQKQIEKQTEKLQQQQLDRKACYSPWQMQQDSEMIQLGSIYEHG